MDGPALWEIFKLKCFDRPCTISREQCPPRKSPSARKKSVEGRGLQATSHLVLVEQDSLYCYADISVAESESGNNSL